MAVVFSILSVLFGVYLGLFLLAMWSTYRRASSFTQRILRVITIALFCVSCTHFIARALVFARARRITPLTDEEVRWTVPLIFVGSTTSTISATLSDGLVAWRCYVLYGRSRLIMYISSAAIAIDALLGLSGDFQQFSAYHSVDFYNDHIHMIALDVKAAWGWSTFAINTVLTASIAIKIVSISRMGPDSPNVPSVYSTAFEAIIESALITWIGLLLYEITSFAPTGHITTKLDIGYIMVCITPVFFGISQCLITARLGFSTGALDKTVTSVAGGPVALETGLSRRRRLPDEENLGEMTFTKDQKVYHGNSIVQLSSVGVSEKSITSNGEDETESGSSSRGND